MTDTPETDYLENNLGNASHPTLLFFCRKLERERDEAREWEQTACDTLREVCRQIGKTKDMTTQRNDARDALSKISLYLSVGMGDNSTTAHQYYERIIEGIQMLTHPIMQMLDEAREYADKLAEGLPEGMLPKDVEVLREANLGLATELAEQRDKLTEANHSLAVMLEDERKKRDMYQDQADYFLEQWGKTQERMFNAELGLLNSNKREFTLPYINKTINE